MKTPVMTALTAALGAVLVSAVVNATNSAGSDSPALAPQDVVVDAPAAAVLATLDALPIKGRAPKTGYDRALFGQAWSDDVTVEGGHNGCDTRNDILARDLVDIEVKQGTHGCVVLSGTLHDSYTGKVIAFQRGKGTSRQVQIDHIVALSDGWQKGAQQWDADTRRNFANDPLNLQAVDGTANQQKRDGDAATWLPPNKSYRCAYVSRIVAVKDKYGLWVTQAEHDAIERIVSTGCHNKPASPASRAPASLTGPTWASRSVAPAGLGRPASRLADALASDSQVLSESVVTGAGYHHD